MSRLQCMFNMHHGGVSIIALSNLSTIILLLRPSAETSTSEITITSIWIKVLVPVSGSGAGMNDSSTQEWEWVLDCCYENIAKSVQLDCNEYGGFIGIAAQNKFYTNNTQWEWNHHHHHHQAAQLIRIQIWMHQEPFHAPWRSTRFLHHTHHTTNGYH